MQEFVRDLARWWDDPVTQALAASLGALIILNGIERAHQRADRLEVRVGSLERRMKRDA